MSTMSAFATEMLDIVSGGALPPTSSNVILLPDGHGGYHYYGSTTPVYNFPPNPPLPVQFL